MIVEYITSNSLNKIPGLDCHRLGNHPNRTIRANLEQGASLISILVQVFRFLFIWLYLYIYLCLAVSRLSVFLCPSSLSNLCFAVRNKTVTCFSPVKVELMYAVNFAKFAQDAGKVYFCRIY
jgi:hypothetical protein